MGGGSWSSATYSATTNAKAAAGKPTFEYDVYIRSNPTAPTVAHDLLDPRAVNNDGAHKGTNVREALDSDEHPNSTPIAVFFDVTGSMHAAPRELQKKLPELFGLLLRKGYVDDPQIAFGAVGDAYSDKVPVQVGQFESDNRLDDVLANIYLEGWGGGGNHESYDLFLYWLANKTYTDRFHKRGQRGYAFFVGDERLYRKVRAAHVEKHFGDTTQGDLDTIDVYQQAAEMWDIYFVFAGPAAGSYSEDAVVAESASSSDALGWREVVGQNIIALPEIGDVCEVIALQIGLAEGTIDLDDGLADLGEIGVTSAKAEAIGSALVPAGGGGVATIDGGDLPASGDGTGVDRL